MQFLAKYRITNLQLMVCRKLGNEMVDIYVGPEEQLVRVHKSRLCNRIDYFDKMFNGKFKEAIDNVARLPEDDPAEFDVLIQWVYCPKPDQIQALTTITNSEGQGGPSWDAVGFYSLAEKYCLRELQNLIMDALLKYHIKQDELPAPSFVDRAYSRTSSESLMAKYALRTIYFILASESNIYDKGWPSSEIEKLFKDHPTFAADYINVQRKEESMDPRIDY